MIDGVLYMNIGNKHAEHLVVSIYSLRRHWQGPVAIACGDETAMHVGQAIRKDHRLGQIELIEFDHASQGRGSMYAAKCDMDKFSPFDRTVFLDADTLVVGDFQDMFPKADTSQVRLTRFSDWTTQSNLMRGRIEKWRNACPIEVESALAYSWAAINTGVIGFSRHSDDWFQDWRETTHKNVGFICDEIAAQLIYPRNDALIMDERWNASPVYSWERHGPDAEYPDPRIWHGHGFKFHKKDTGRILWMPEYTKAMNENIANMAVWGGLAHGGTYD